MTPLVTQLILRYMVKYNASDLDRTFSALADPTRRAVLLRLKKKPGLSVSEHLPDEDARISHEAGWSGFLDKLHFFLGDPE